MTVTIDALRETGDALARAEALRNAAAPRSGALEKRAVAARIAAARSALDAVIADAPPAGLRHPDAQAAAEAQRAVALSAAAHVLATAVGPDNRLAQLQGLLSGGAERAAEIRRADDPANPNRAAEAADALMKAKSAARALEAFFRDPMASVGAASRFWNGAMHKMAQTRFTRAFSRLTFGEGCRILDLVVDDVGQAKKGAVAVSRVLGAAAWMLIAASVVLATIADQTNWASAFAKSALAAGSGIVASALITSSAIASLGTAFLAAVGSTSEMPPVAAVIAAVGIVVMIGIAAAKLFDFLIDTWFGGGIPPSMRLQMADPMSRSMVAAMAAPMAAGMT